MRKCSEWAERALREAKWAWDCFGVGYPSKNKTRALKELWRTGVLKPKRKKMFHVKH